MNSVVFRFNVDLVYKTTVIIAIQPAYIILRINIVQYIHKNNNDFKNSTIIKKYIN